MTPTNGAHAEKAIFGYQSITLRALPNRREGLEKSAWKPQQNEFVKDSTMPTEQQLQIKSAWTAPSANQAGKDFERAQTRAQCERPCKKQSQARFNAGFLKISLASLSGACAKETL